MLTSLLKEKMESGGWGSLPRTVECSEAWAWPCTSGAGWGPTWGSAGRTLSEAERGRQAGQGGGTEPLSFYQRQRPL